VVDGIVGIGGSGGLREDATQVVEALAGVPVIAVDTPSGVDVDTGRIDGPHVRAAVTVTFGTHKPAHLVDPAAMACGAVHLVDIGLDLPEPQITALQEADVARLLPRPAPEVVVGLGRVQAWVIGSGGGADAEQALRDSLEDGVPVVVDADGLQHVTGPLGVPALLTPHAGELGRMLDVPREQVEAEQLRFAREAAERYDAVVLLKGRHTLVAAPTGKVRVTTTGTPWLATAGAGDVLAGLCGALVAAGLDPFDAGSVGSWVHGAAAALAGHDGPVTAAAVAGAIPQVCRALLAGVEDR
jgi:NAD(P)H-hydrate repair Nnr-like enzyme with NAD(P)H-hydrate dehydratase domain